MLQTLTIKPNCWPTSSNIWAQLFKSELRQRQALDPLSLMQAASLTPDPWQAQVLTSAAPRLLLCCCRQSGKSLVTAVLAWHTALAQPGSLILLLSPSLRQSQELFRTVMQLRRAPVPTEHESALRIQLRNGSRIVALPGTESTVRGYSNVRLLVIDEAARVLDTLYHSVTPMLAVSGGRLIALSTPFGKRGWFYHEYSQGEGWKRVMITAAQCPRISATFLEQERRSLPRLWYASEYLCEFTETVDSVFSYDDIQAAMTDEVQPLFGRQR